MSIAIYIGMDRDAVDAYLVSLLTVSEHTKRLQPYTRVEGLSPAMVETYGYNRPAHRLATGRLFDPISNAPMSTEFAISRFMTPIVGRAAWASWAIFVDGDIMVRSCLKGLIDSLDDDYAVQCVKHRHAPINTTKMDGQEQTVYDRKNWSSVMAFNLRHPSNNKLTLQMINSLPGRDLHRFCWLDDHEIGALHPQYNYLVGHTTLPKDVEPVIVHYTDGVPSTPGHRYDEYSEEWRKHIDWGMNCLRF